MHVGARLTISRLPKPQCSVKNGLNLGYPAGFVRASCPLQRLSGKLVMTNLCGVLLDVDGTLIDSNDAHAHAWHDAFREFGFELDYASVRRLIGMGGDNLMPAAIGIAKESEQGEKISERRSEIFKQQYLPTIKSFPRTPDLLARLHATGYKLAVATSSGKSQLAALLRIAHAEPYIDAKTSADDAESSKPDPDIIEAALRKTGCPVNRVLMLGDTPYDIEAAAKAAIKTVALRSGGWCDAELKGALAIYDDPADLLENFDQSPFALNQERRGK